ncbi:MAG: RidA family protein [Chloroflexi bacterium]|nr:MAG: RidA family protein [Chloroflexota bacterium]
MQREIISTPHAPAAVGPYSQAVKIGQFVFTAGQIPLVPETGKLVEGDIKAQTTQVMKNLTAVLETAGTNLDNVVKTTIFVADLADFAAVNEVYGSYFTGAPPARSTVQVAGLPLGAAVEIEMVAAIPGK